MILPHVNVLVYGTRQTIAAPDNARSPEGDIRDDVDHRADERQHRRAPDNRRPRKREFRRATGRSMSDLKVTGLHHPDPHLIPCRRLT